MVDSSGTIYDKTGYVIHNETDINIEYYYACDGDKDFKLRKQNLDLNSMTIVDIDYLYDFDDNNLVDADIPRLDIHSLPSDRFDMRLNNEIDLGVIPNFEGVIDNNKRNYHFRLSDQALRDGGFENNFNFTLDEVRKGKPTRWLPPYSYNKPQNLYISG